MARVRARLQMRAATVGRLAVQRYVGWPGPPGRNTLLGRLRGGLTPRAWEPVKQAVFRATAETFAKEGYKQGYDYGWVEYKYDPYWLWKQRTGHGDRLLVLTGRLRDQLSGRTGDHYEQMRPRKMTIGSNYPVAGSSGQRSSPFTEGVGGAVLPEWERWSLDPDNEDVGGLHASAAPGQPIESALWDPMWETAVPVPARPMWRFDSGEIDEICEAILDFVTMAGRAP
jgi:hypothetical protein